MKAIKKYFQKREDSIHFLLEKPKRSYTPATFHKLRVEIKKLNALFELINYCSDEFRRQKKFKPFKLIFRQAGKVREIQVEVMMLKKYFRNHLLSGYRENLKKLLIKKQEAFFSITNKEFVEGMKKNYSAIIPFFAQIDNKKVMSYMDRKRNKIEKLLNQDTLQTSQLHELRKRIKKFNYNRRILKSGKQNKLLSQRDVLPELLGKWHDCQVTISDLQKAIDSSWILAKEISQLEKIKAKIFSEREILLNKISKAIPESEFFSAVG